jgi:predicted Na+-dependent transporter
MKWDFADLVRELVGLIDVAIPVLLGLALALFLWSGVKYVYKAGDAKGKGEERQALLWGLVAMFVLFSLWGILALLKESFIGSDSGSAEGPIDIRPPYLR